MSSRLVVALVAIVLAASVRVASAADARIITYDDAVKIALEQNNTLRQAQVAAKQSSVAVDQARNQFKPDLSVSTRGGKSFGRNFNEEEGQVIDTTTSSVSLGLASGVTLFDGFANTAGLKGAKLSEQASHFDLQRTRETVVFTVASNFIALVQAQEELRVQRENIAAASALEQQISRYVDAGARTIADLYQQQAAVASARLAVVQAERTAQLAEVDLVQTLQLDPAGVYQFDAPPFDAAAAESEALDLEAMLSGAYAQRADLRAQEGRVKAADQAVRVAGSNRWPQISLSAGYSTNYTSASDFSVLDQFDQRRGGSVNLGISFPIYDRGSTRVAVRQAELAADSERINLDNSRQEVGLEVRRAYLDLRAAREQLSSADSQVKAADLALQAAQDRYDAGAATLVELSQARATHVQAASAQVEARTNLLFQRTLIDYYTGKRQLTDNPAQP